MKCCEYRTRCQLSQNFFITHESCKFGQIFNLGKPSIVRSLPLRGGPGVNLIKPYWHKFTASFCKLHLFIEMQQMCIMFIKRSSLHKSVCKFLCQNSFVKLTSGRSCKRKPRLQILYKIETLQLILLTEIVSCTCSQSHETFFILIQAYMGIIRRIDA